jgi:uncharacterized iron-regulated protein
MKKLLFFWIILFFTGCASLPTVYLDLDDHKALSLDSVLKKISEERVIFIGEIHGTASIHLLQLEIIKRLRQSNKELVVALEVFPFTRQEILNKWIGGSLSRHDFEQAYSANWSVPFEYYAGIFDYAKEQHIPLVAINAEDRVIREVSKKGLQAVPKDFLRKIERIASDIPRDPETGLASEYNKKNIPCIETPCGLAEGSLQFTDCSADTVYKELVNSIYHASELPFFCDGQRLRDSVMAFNIANAMRGNNYTVVVLAGVAHASRLAVPLMLENHIEATYTVLLPEEVKYFIKRTPDKNIADYVWY